MKIHRNLITPAKGASFDEDVDLSDLDYARFPSLKGLSDVHAEGEFYRDEDENLMVALRVSGVATLSDSRTSEIYDDPFDFEDEFQLLKDVAEEGEGYVFPENVIELHDVVFCAIHSYLPICPHKPGSKLPSSGEGYSILTEDEVKPLENTSPFAALDDYDVEDK